VEGDFTQDARIAIEATAMQVMQLEDKTPDTLIAYTHRSCFAGL
jgi:hypothetical protein